MRVHAPVTLYSRSTTPAEEYGCFSWCNQASGCETVGVQNSPSGTMTCYLLDNSGNNLLTESSSIKAWAKGK